MKGYRALLATALPALRCLLRSGVAKICPKKSKSFAVENAIDTDAGIDVDGNELHSKIDVVHNGARFARTQRGSLRSHATVLALCARTGAHSHRADGGENILDVFVEPERTMRKRPISFRKRPKSVRKHSKSVQKHPKSVRKRPKTSESLSKNVRFESLTSMSTQTQTLEHT